MQKVGLSILIESILRRAVNSTCTLGEAAYSRHKVKISFESIRWIYMNLQQFFHSYFQHFKEFYRIDLYNILLIARFQWNKTFLITTATNSGTRSMAGQGTLNVIYHEMSERSSLSDKQFKRTRFERERMQQRKKESFSCKT
jgi:hypothetical protein